MDPLDSSISLGGASEAAAAREDVDSPDGSLPWARFSAWLECVCVVTFDLELGQAIEVNMAHTLCANDLRKLRILSTQLTPANVNATM